MAMIQATIDLRAVFSTAANEETMVSNQDSMILTKHSLFNQGTKGVSEIIASHSEQTSFFQQEPFWADQDIQIIGSSTGKPRKLHPKFRPVSANVIIQLQPRFYFQYISEPINIPLPSFDHLTLSHRSSSISSSFPSDESTFDPSPAPSPSPFLSSNDDNQSSSVSSKSKDDYHVLYINMNGEYVPIAKTAFMIPTSLPASKPVPPIVNNRKKNYLCTHAGCTKAYYKSSHLKAHMRLHTGKEKTSIPAVILRKKSLAEVSIFQGRNHFHAHGPIVTKHLLVRTN